ncbi:MAG: cobalamin-binding protein [Gammaproteobacteria bacterium]|nr:cobalamin-binding protein [Gammaproteobacteria bacterium]
MLPLRVNCIANALLALAFAAPVVSAEIRVQDDFGRDVVLPAPAARIVSLAPHITENLFAAGAGDKVVGAVPPVDYPPEAARIPPVGDHARVSVEAVLALAPDLVVAWRTESHRAGIEKLEQLGYPVYYSQPRGFEGIIETVEEFAQLAGSEARINPEKLRAELAAVRADYAAKTELGAFYQVWKRPLMTLNGEHMISRALEMCGARNIFAHLPIIAPRISEEAVVEANPDIIIGGMRGDMSMWNKWKSVNAVAHGGVVRANTQVLNRNTPRMILGLRNFCERIDEVRRIRPNPSPLPPGANYQSRAP